MGPAQPGGGCDHVVPDKRNARRRGLRASAGIGVKAPRHKRPHTGVIDLSIGGRPVERRSTLAIGPHRRCHIGRS